MSNERSKGSRTTLVHEVGAIGLGTTLGAIRQWINQADALGYEDDRPVWLYSGSISIGDESSRLYDDPNPAA